MTNDKVKPFVKKYAQHEGDYACMKNIDSQLKGIFPENAEGRRMTIRTFRKIMRNRLGGFPLLRSEIVGTRLREMLRYDSSNDSIAVSYEDLKPLNYPRADLYWDALETEIGAGELAHNPQYVEWKLGESSRRPKKGVFHGRFGDALERDAENEAVRRISRHPETIAELLEDDRVNLLIEHDADSPDTIY